MSTSLRQRVTPQKISPSYDAQQQYESTSIRSPQSYQQQISPAEAEFTIAPTSIPARAGHASEQYSSSKDMTSRFWNTTSSNLPHSKLFVRSNSSSISIDDCISSSVTHNSGSDDPQNRWKQRCLLCIGLLFLVAPWMRHSRVQWEVNKLKDELIELQNDQLRLQARLRSQKDAYSKITNDIAKYQNRNSELFQQLRSHGDHYFDFDAEHYKEQTEKEDEYLKRIDILEKEVQRMADRQLAGRGYGTPFRRSNGIRVEIILQQDVSIYGNKLVMELGPLSFLSHAIELFLKLVEHEHYYDNLMLMHQSMGSSVIGTVPLESETLQFVPGNVMKNGHPLLELTEGNNSPKLTSRGNTFMTGQLAMLEYDEDYPIQKYSVLFADKGPHFYIQMDDVPKKTKEKHQQETCFGRIVEGHAVLEYMKSHHTKNSRGMYMVGIKTLNVLQPTESNRDNYMAGMDPRISSTSEVIL